MPKKCLYVSCDFFVFAKGFCRKHQACRDDKKSTIKRESPKRAQINRKLYTPNARLYLQQNPLCQIKIENVCTIYSQGVHHIKGKKSIELLLDERFWMASCNACNLFLETHSAEAKNLGFKLPDYDSKLSKLK